MSVRPRVLMAQPSLQPPGGGNAVAAWMLQALAGRCDLTVLTWRPVELEEVNRYYGTSIRESDATWSAVPAPVRSPIERVPVPVVLLKASLLFRHAKSVAPAFDVVICGHNETDFGPRCIQYVHYPARLRPRPAVDLRWFHAWAPLLRAYYGVCDRLARFDVARVAQATTLANSSWTAGLVTRLYGGEVQPIVVHPPVTVAPQGIPWESRDDAFVCIGRLAPEKELERVIEIVAEVRRRGPQARLHIVGSRGPRAYVRKIRRLATERGEWLRIHEDVSRERLLELIARSRYAIHGMREEHFGIAPAEALAGGCILFVPNGGGQVDIVGDAPRLRYDSVDDAAEKITAVMESPTLQAELRSYVASRGGLFSGERFMGRIRDLVKGMAERPA